MSGCTLITYEQALELQHRDQMWRQAKAEMAEARRTRTCVWCGEGIRADRVYPACEECREYKQVTKP